MQSHRRREISCKVASRSPAPSRKLSITCLICSPLIIGHRQKPMGRGGGKPVMIIRCSRRANGSSMPVDWVGREQGWGNCLSNSRKPLSPLPPCNHRGKFLMMLLNVFVSLTPIWDVMCLTLPRVPAYCSFPRSVGKGRVGGHLFFACPIKMIEWAEGKVICCWIHCLCKPRGRKWVLYHLFCGWYLLPDIFPRQVKQGKAKTFCVTQALWLCCTAGQAVCCGSGSWTPWLYSQLCPYMKLGEFLAFKIQIPLPGCQALWSGN